MCESVLGKDLRVRFSFRVGHVHKTAHPVHQNERSRDLVSLQEFGKKAILCPSGNAALVRRPAES